MYSMPNKIKDRFNSIFYYKPKIIINPESIKCIPENTMNQILKEKNLNSQKLSISEVIKANTVQCLEVNLVITDYFATL